LVAKSRTGSSVTRHSSSESQPALAASSFSASSCAAGVRTAAAATARHTPPKWAVHHQCTPAPRLSNAATGEDEDRRRRNHQWVRAGRPKGKTSGRRRQATGHPSRRHRRCIRDQCGMHSVPVRCYLLDCLSSVRFLLPACMERLHCPALDLRFILSRALLWGDWSGGCVK
jgi:hypothetical protein